MANLPARVARVVPGRRKGGWPGWAGWPEEHLEKELLARCLILVYPSITGR